MKSRSAALSASRSAKAWLEIHPFSARKAPARRLLFVLKGNGPRRPRELPALLAKFSESHQPGAEQEQAAGSRFGNGRYIKPVKETIAGKHVVAGRRDAQPDRVGVVVR